MKFIYKIPVLILAITWSQSTIAQNFLSNEQVRRELESVIRSTDMPIKGDSLTTLVSMETFGRRGLQYNFFVNASKNDIDKNMRAISITINTVKNGAIENLCQNPLMIWYKENIVGLRYTYHTKAGERFAAFTITTNDC